jgi:hypothetical protein
MLDPNMGTTLCTEQFRRQTFFSDDHDMLGKEYIEGQAGLSRFFYFYFFCLGENIMGLKD